MYVYASRKLVDNPTESRHKSINRARSGLEFRIHQKPNIEFRTLIRNATKFIAEKCSSVLFLNVRSFFSVYVLLQKLHKRLTNGTSRVSSFLLFFSYRDKISLADVPACSLIGYPSVCFSLSF